MNTTCFDIFEQCVTAVQAGDLIESVSERDKEFHFQNWFEQRLNQSGVAYERSGRNQFPDFRIVEPTEGYEVKGLAWPGRAQNYDSNSQVPTGYHNGRQVFYVFGRYPADTSSDPVVSRGGRYYPVIDLVICHGDFLNADHEYVHQNKHIKGFGTYGDIMVRDRKMYVAPTPFAIVEGATGLMTLIVPAHVTPDQRFQAVGHLTRIESDTLVVGYRFDLQTNQIVAEYSPNPNAGKEHHFFAYRLVSQTPKRVLLTKTTAHPSQTNAMGQA